MKFPHLLSIRGACTPEKLFLSGAIECVLEYNYLLIYCQPKFPYPQNKFTIYEKKPHTLKTFQPP